MVMAKSIDTHPVFKHDQVGVGDGLGGKAGAKARIKVMAWGRDHYRAGCVCMHICGVVKNMKILSIFHNLMIAEVTSEYAKKILLHFALDVGVINYSVEVPPILSLKNTVLLSPSCFWRHKTRCFRCL